MNLKIWMLSVPLIFLLSSLTSLLKKGHPYDDFVKGINEGLVLIKEILPSLVTMVIAVELLRACGVIKDLAVFLNDKISNASYFIELLPMAIFRPLSGSASISVINNICLTHGPDSLLCKTVSAIQGSTDTTFYVIALYYGSINVTKWRHTLFSGLLADLIGIFSAISLSLMMFG